MIKQTIKCISTIFFAMGLSACIPGNVSNTPKGSSSASNNIRLQATAIGGATGAALGGVIGKDAKSAAIGGVVGAAGGYAAGQALDQNKQHHNTIRQTILQEIYRVEQVTLTIQAQNQQLQQEIVFATQKIQQLRQLVAQRRITQTSLQAEKQNLIQRYNAYQRAWKNAETQLKYAQQQKHSYLAQNTNRQLNSDEIAWYERKIASLNEQVRVYRKSTTKLHSVVNLISL
ncbi:glycine zipper domain-containing protein [Candidatus Venteria ishoeyi]|uniref:Glycine zipper domain-containing protein n=1 Tax=Candidatus Venteria ishoeyi TaxID=1899563 RepID=A0A1H6F226_9GAMM|nr:glycine zipper domain-containing protein [Candidatus Venteria ishoeyi]SEH04180.1 Uncharacterised protein [Candidatus Venteria ishoeyi]